MPREVDENIDTVRLDPGRQLLIAQPLDRVPVRHDLLQACSQAVGDGRVVVDDELDLSTVRVTEDGLEEAPDGMTVKVGGDQAHLQPFCAIRQVGVRGARRDSGGDELTIAFRLGRHLIDREIAEIVDGEEIFAPTEKIVRLERDGAAIVVDRLPHAPQ